MAPVPPIATATVPEDAVPQVFVMNVRPSTACSQLSSAPRTALLAMPAAQPVSVPTQTTARPASMDSTWPQTVPASHATRAARLATPVTSMVAPAATILMFSKTVSAKNPTPSVTRPA